MAYAEDNIEGPISINQLHLDLENPRLPEDAEGKDEEGVLKILYRDFYLSDLAESLNKNGYFREEPLVVIPDPKQLKEKFKGKSTIKFKNIDEFKAYVADPNTNFIVVEGNRRIATIKLLCSGSLRKKLNVTDFPKEVTKERIESFSKVFAIVYLNRSDVFPYLGVRHMVGIEPWEPYAKARYVVKLMDKPYNRDIDDIMIELGDRRADVLKSYLAYKIVEKADELGLPTVEAKRDKFTYLTLSLRNNTVREYIGIGDLNKANLSNPIPKNKYDNLKNYFSLIFGDGNKQKGVITDSRDLNKLWKILDNKKARESLFLNRDFSVAMKMTERDEDILLDAFVIVNYQLKEVILSRISDNKENKEIKDEYSKTLSVIEQINKLLGK